MSGVRWLVKGKSDPHQKSNHYRQKKHFIERLHTDSPLHINVTMETYEITREMFQMKVSTTAFIPLKNFCLHSFIHIIYLQLASHLLLVFGWLNSPTMKHVVHIGCFDVLTSRGEVKARFCKMAASGPSDQILDLDHLSLAPQGLQRVMLSGSEDRLGFH